MATHEGKSMSKGSLKSGQRRRKMKAVMAHLSALETTPRIEAEGLRARARDAILDQMASNLTLLQATVDPNERRRLGDANHDLNRSLKRLVADQLKEINEAPEIQQALDKLRALTDSLVMEAKKTRDVTEAITTATAVIGLVTRIIALFAPFL